MMTLLKPPPLIRTARVDQAAGDRDGRITRTGATPALDVERIRRQFAFVGEGRIVTNNAASTQSPDALLARMCELSRRYDNVHRGQSSASRETSERFEHAYDTIARWINAPSRRSIATYRNTTEAINSVMYQLLTEVRDGDNIVTTMLEHNSNFVPWFALANEILPRFGRRVECRIADLDPVAGTVDLDHLATLVDERTKLVCCTGASNFFGCKPDLTRLREMTAGSGYIQPSGARRSLLLVDGAQLMPTTYVDVQELDLDYLAFSFHKMLAPFGVGVLYAKEELLASSAPFLYGGDMIAEGQVHPDRVAYNDLPWKFAAGTPNILGVIVSAEALRLTLDLALGTVGAAPARDPWFATDREVTSTAVRDAMSRIGAHTRMLTDHALERLGGVPEITIYGPPAGCRRSPLVAFNVAGHDPMTIATELDRLGIESRAGCHCATLAHHRLGLDPPASCRLSFALYNTVDEVEHVTRAVRWIVSQGQRPSWDPPQLGLDGKSTILRIPRLRARFNAR